jgi:hypothetical protein
VTYKCSCDYVTCKDEIVLFSTLRQSTRIHNTSTCYHYFIGVSETVKELQRFNEVIKNPSWQDAMDKEMESMESIQKMIRGI